ncbi:uncharacterized protein LOC135397212 [Ornithodoros turicata]|uniref:uncharacterized protein LOC135397212 n=1 Tax=Ornithodoros turicata TaxID=34597 RepID=UPI0031394803
MNTEDKTAFYKRMGTYTAIGIFLIVAVLGFVYFATGTEPYNSELDDRETAAPGGARRGAEKKDRKVSAAVQTTTIRTSTTPSGPPDSMSRPLLCHYSSRAGRSTAFPEDGLCDIIYHIHLDVDHVFSTDPTAWNFKDQLSVFLENAREAVKTMYGVSIWYKRGRFTLNRLQTAEGQKALGALWDMNVKHYGMLRIFGSLQEIGDIQATHLKLLKTLRVMQRKLSEQTQDRRYHYLALGLQLDYSEWERHKRAFVAKLSEITTQFPVDLFILRSHMYVFHPEEQCRVHGPALWHKSFNSHLPSLEAAAKILNMTAISHQTIVLLSLTLSSMLYSVPGLQESKKVIGARCSNFTTAYEHQTCNLPAGFSLPKKDEAGQVMYSVNKDKRLVYTWDTIKTLQAKMNQTFHAYDRQRFGFAALNFMYEDYSNVCNDTVFGMGFHRLRAIRKMLKSVA